MKLQVRAVLFDAVGTLIRPRERVASIYQQVSHRHGFTLSQSEIAGRFSRAFARQELLDAHEGHWKTSEARERQRWRDIVGEVFDDGCVPQRIDALFDDLWQHFASPQNWELYEDAAETWRALATRDLPLGVASNMDARLEDIGRELPPLDTCRHWFISSRIGVRKPSDQFFAAIAEAFRLQPAQLLLVGDDRANDYEGARRCGWQVCFVDRSGRSSHDVAVRDLRELMSLLA